MPNITRAQWRRGMYLESRLVDLDTGHVWAQVDWLHPADNYGWRFWTALPASPVPPGTWPDAWPAQTGDHAVRVAEAKLGPLVSIVPAPEAPTRAQARALWQWQSLPQESRDRVTCNLQEDAESSREIATTWQSNDAPPDQHQTAMIGLTTRDIVAWEAAVALLKAYDHV